MTLDRRAPPHSRHPPTLARPAELKAEGVHLFAFRVKVARGWPLHPLQEQVCVIILTWGFAAVLCSVRAAHHAIRSQAGPRGSLHSIRTRLEGDTAPLGSLCL